MPKITRREALSLIAVTTAGAIVVPRAAFGQAVQLSGPAVCFITPESTEGPFYFDPALLRADITEGRPGLPVDLRLQIVSETCQAISGARVDVWQCDALGAYSGYDNASPRETFMRGTQLANAAGGVTFRTVYPGWYPGRTPHIHFKVFVDETTLLTGQLFFPDDVSDKVYATLEPYAQRGNSGRTVNTTDGIAQRAGERAMARVAELPDAYLVEMVIGVEPPPA